MNGRCVFLCLKTGSVKFLRLSNVDKIVSSLAEPDSHTKLNEAVDQTIFPLRVRQIVWARDYGVLASNNLEKGLVRRSK